MTKKFIKAGLTSGLLLPALAFAQGGITPVSPVAGRQVDVFDIITRIIGWLTGLLVVLAVIFIVWAAFIYLTAGGDAEKAGKANKMLIYAAVAIAIALLSQGIVFIVGKLFAPTVTPTL